MSEKNFWSYMRGALPIKMYRVENKVSKGMPDIHFVKSGNSGWIELKFVKSFEPDKKISICLLYTSPSPRDGLLSRMPSSA